MTVQHTDDAHTVFLTTRSNYQNLIEGTHLPGVSYPTELSTNLTSKRTSHKIAEQGRRNRINLALQEMHRLLPKVSGKGGTPSTPGPMDHDSPKREDDDGKGGKGGGNSKAATVESAIDYIRALQRESEEKEREVAVMKKRMEAMEKAWEQKGLPPLDE
jgi:hypothetical protein